MSRGWAVAAAGVAAAVTLGLAATAAGGSGGSGGADVLGPGSAEVELRIEHSRFSVDEITVVAGTEVTFDVVNDDPIHHELIVGDAAVHARHELGHEAQHLPVPGEVSVDPLATASTTYRFDEVGEVAFACHLPGHVAFGMVGTVHVVPA